jgi:hypothetical protein
MFTKENHPMKTNSTTLHSIATGALLGGLFALTGCGSDSAVVAGKVTFQGAAVNGGALQFLPVASGDSNPGMPAAGEIQPDGTYVLGRESKADGAVVGKHRVIYTPPMPQLADPANAKPGDRPPPSPYAGLQPMPAEVELKPGSNTVDIELLPRAT